MLFASYIRRAATSSVLAIVIALPVLSVAVPAVEPSAEAARLGRVAAPFITPNTQGIVYVDVARTNLKKISDEVIAKASGPDMIKGMAMMGLGSVIGQHEEFKKSGIAEAILIVGGKVDENGKPDGQPEMIAIVRKSPNAKAEDVIEKVRELVRPEDQPFIAKTWVVADWIAMGPTDPQALAAPKEKRPIKQMTDLFDHLLAAGRGAHTAFIPQPTVRQPHKDAIAKLKKNIDPAMPPQVNSLPKLGELLVDGEFTSLSIVTDPEPKIILTASAADADAGKEVNRILVNFVEMIPDLPQFQENADGAKKLVESLTPKLAHNRVTVSLQTSDGSLTHIVGMGLEQAGPLMMMGPPPGFGDGPGFPPAFGDAPPGFGPPAGSEEETAEEDKPAAEEDADADENEEEASEEEEDSK